MFQRIRDLVADVCRYEETAPINSACMRCILLWSAVVLVMLLVGLLRLSRAGGKCKRREHQADGDQIYGLLHDLRVVTV